MTYSIAARWLVIGVMLAGCQSATRQALPSSPLRDHPPVGPHELRKPYSAAEPNGLFHLSCTDKYPDGRSIYTDLGRDEEKNGRVALARRYFMYAAMASNSYREPLRKPRFATPGWTFEYALESTSGLAAELYRADTPAGEPGRLVIAFRGTEPEINDWLTNFSLSEPRQFREAMDWVRKIRQDNPGSAVAVTGHSLGGAIALNLSMRFEALDAVVFNASPRAFFGQRTPYANQRVYIYEYGEFLSLLGSKYIDIRMPPGLIFGNYNFLDYRFYTVSVFPEHSIYEMTRALTLVALSAGERAAYRFFRANIPESVAVAVDPANCTHIYRQAVASR